ncbi:hypothetical protein PHET_01326 [Paragonimus heterotremus]|uniref:Ig-like domain-containing protein n=1 Tax=Paragonimus heterotremus TaxID=100268 RepID=A0A8J4STQ0_9TREM|nr:hypothetical protein PHET_01326 [Paragonimus heterotremus]
MRHTNPALYQVSFCVILLRIAQSGLSSPPLFFTEDTDYIIISENESAILPCQSSDGLDVFISWFKDETMIADNVNHSFRLSRATRLDSGIYYCIMRNNYGGIRGRKIKLETGYLDPTPVSTTRTLVDVRVGEALVFWPEAYKQNGPVTTISSLNTEGNHLTTVPIAVPPARARWTINNAPILNSPTVYLSHTEQALVLLNVDHGLNEMVIRAELTNGYGPTNVFTQSYVIGVSEPLPNQGGMRSLQLVLAPKDVVLVLRPDQPGQATFECVFNARPAKSLRVKWYRKVLRNTVHMLVPIEASPTRFPAPRSQTERIYRFDQSGFNRSLTIFNIHRPVAYNVEEYTCQAHLDNYAASSLAENVVVRGPFEEPLSATARLKINTPPAVRFASDVHQLVESVKNGKARAAIIQAVASSYVRLACDIENEGHPKAELVWLKNAQMVSANDTRLVIPVK